MDKPYFRSYPFNFGFFKNQNFEMAKIVIVPVPYEATVIGGANPQSGPLAIIEASQEIDEIWGEKRFSLLEEKKLIYTENYLELSRNSPQEAVGGLADFLQGIVGKNKIPFILGGEHLLSLAVATALKKKYKNFSVLQLDAHPDLRNEYAGTKYSHATVMRRIAELKIPITAVGVRSVDCDTAVYIKEKRIKNIFYAPKVPVARILKTLSENVYLTIDLDVFDPSIMPSVSNPQPGGLGWYEVLNLIEKTAEEKNIIGADLVELSPLPGFPAPNILAAKLIYEIISRIADDSERKI